MLQQVVRGVTNGTEQLSIPWILKAPFISQFRHHPGILRTRVYLKLPLRIVGSSKNPQSPSVSEGLAVSLSRSVSSQLARRRQSIPLWPRTRRNGRRKESKCFSRSRFCSVPIDSGKMTIKRYEIRMRVNFPHSIPTWRDIGEK